MELPQTGGCQCGKVRYEITQAPQSIYTCHCTACQRLTSSAFSMGLVVAEAAFHLSGVEPKPLQRVADSGRVNTRLVSGVRLLDLRPAAGRRGPRACRQPRRYVLAAPDPAHLDPQQAAVDHLCPGRRGFRSATARLTWTTEFSTT
jgi:hypothetical protein